MASGDDRVLSKEEAKDLFEDYDDLKEIKALKNDLQFCQDLIAGYEIRTEEFRRYIRALESLQSQREKKLLKLEETLTELERQLLKLK